MQNYFLDDDSNFVIKNYQNAKPFTSLLPGIAGSFGIPMWVFYVNRGQAVTSFGHKSKDHPILEFQPANRAYQVTPYLGFRTFLKIQREKQVIFYEPFSNRNNSQEMIIGSNVLKIKENSRRLGLATEITYFSLPGENLSGLVRKVKLTNQSSKKINIDLLDGLPSVVPYGVDDQMLKGMGRTVEAWMEVYNLDQNIPFYKLRASVADTVEVSSFAAGNYMMAFQEGSSTSKPLSMIVDPKLIFGQNTSLSEPDGFYQSGLKGILAKNQITCGRTPCGFTGLQTRVNSGESIQVFSITGHAGQFESVINKIKRISSSGYLNEKLNEASRITADLTNSIYCRTSSKEFDAYCRQTYLDNLLRGGVPIVFGSGKSKKIFYTYSRKHGDPERDYNAFEISPEFFSQGNGNYRDINQNRRGDVWFNPEIEELDIRTFMSLIQLDGYNPLVLKGTRFTVPPEKFQSLSDLTDDSEKLQELLASQFTPGGILQKLRDNGIRINVDPWKFLERILAESDQHIEADFGEGYWVDHWTYNLDLIESYLSVYPEKTHDLFFEQNEIPWYYSQFVVLPRSQKYVLVDGKPRQMGRPVEDINIMKQISNQNRNGNWTRKNHGTGEIYYSTLVEKMFALVLIKFSTMDPGGMGIEMEAGRPGWYDAINGLPGLFGSSVAESYVLIRTIRLLLSVIQENRSESIRLPVELFQLLTRVDRALQKYHELSLQDQDFIYWEKVSSAREAYRASIRPGVEGIEKDLSIHIVIPILKAFEQKVEDGIARAVGINAGLPPAYLFFSVDEYELIKDRQGNIKQDTLGHSFFHARYFSPHPMPLFLEGMVRAMRVSDRNSAERLYSQVKNSPLYDPSLKMYKVNASLETLSMDVGRARAFTPGWLENESIWLHMEYKYMLEVLRAGLYRQFFADFKKVFIPFLDPNKYGRSILENSSFIVSSVHPDISMHGTGFVNRLSGATAEFLNIWQIMMAGDKLFHNDDGKLSLQLRPIIPSWLFDKNGEISFRFLGQCIVTYHNPKRFDTFDENAIIHKINIYIDGDRNIEISSTIIPLPYSKMVRDGLVRRMDIYYS